MARQGPPHARVGAASEAEPTTAEGRLTRILFGGAFIVAGLLLLAVAARMWSGRYYQDANPRFLRVFPYGSEPWTMPLPLAGYGVVFAGAGSLVLLPHQLVGLAVFVVFVGGIVGVTFSMWQPSWSVPPALRRRRSQPPR